LSNQFQDTGPVPCALVNAQIALKVGVVEELQVIQQVEPDMQYSGRVESDRLHVWRRIEKVRGNSVDASVEQSKSL
jgi:hypothetical protein